MEYLWKLLAEVETDEDPDFDNGNNGPEDFSDETFQITLDNNHVVARMILTNSYVLSRSEFEKPIRICLSPSNFLQHELTPKPLSTPFFYLN
ncbi:hypothetical protein AVEN_248497-1 [Araneus ventricosus]|uniref:Uncharacterized protein n=1 Tax=Araneus ventricosus TaxID=182803 RepID=A0A4Y2DZ75_ARAVE|nr:hypothetical protein AVEN_248497-1 [Araneus ventricosus]